MVDLGTWTAQTVVTEELLDPAPVAALAALLDDGLSAPGEGDELPPLWHWAALPRWAASGELGPDGHPRRGGFLPPIGLPRRMFAGGNLIFHGALRVGSTIRRESEVVSVAEKTGRSGPLVIVDVATRLFDEFGELAVTEMQNLVYREAAVKTEGAEAQIAPLEPPTSTPPPAQPLRRLSEHEWEFRTDASLLARFSAATANAHRIHYDWPYATRVEGYPGLLVHGPLQAIALTELHRLSGGARVERLRHRGLAPLFCGEPARLRATYDGSGSALLELSGTNGDSFGPRSTVELTTDGSPS
ncbi:FAS1-like dehydratase domain-containing protein [Sinomonas humi]|uniref:Dehydratase n=1 Tax=Sinomonas humi TaxID=1338436 RepID=A0A0B2AHY2_9MICC|nr:MaoC family dehydratase N-terminal domain-containing protein [Sinomonas humi]KHL01352.1 dehydratase [Sinomonas humi]